MHRLHQRHPLHPRIGNQSPIPAAGVRSGCGPRAVDRATVRVARPLLVRFRVHAERDEPDRRVPPRRAVDTAGPQPDPPGAEREIDPEGPNLRSGARRPRPRPRLQRVQRRVRRRRRVRRARPPPAAAGPQTTISRGGGRVARRRVQRLGGGGVRWGGDNMRQLGRSRAIL